MKNIYQMYHDNNCRFGFHVSRDSWQFWRYAKVVSIEDVIEGQPISGKPPYYSKPDKRNRQVTLSADWITPGGSLITPCGGNYSWSLIPDNMTDELDAIRKEED